MAAHRGKWIRVTRRHPCPICGKPDNCSVSSDGSRVWCGRISTDSFRENKGGQFLHQLKTVASWEFAKSHLPEHSEPSKPTADWGAYAKLLAQRDTYRVVELSDRLGVSHQSLVRLGVGWHAHPEYWSFPERDAKGKVIGINARYPNGEKKRLKGTKAGLSYANGWRDQPGAIYLVEGGSDTAALLTIGLNVIGRPSNLGGVALLTELLSGIPAKTDIVVIGERDQKENGQWPGRDGAIRVATQLADALDRPIDWSFPPDDAKDARAWLRSMPTLPAKRLADLFVNGLKKTVVAPPKTILVEKRRGPVMPIATWRQQMLAARVESLEAPGFYLDASTTGAGKSCVDLQTIFHAQRMETAA